MSKELNQESEQYVKKLDEITEVDIKNTALDFVATNFGLNIKDCRIEPVQNRQIITEIGGPTSLALPISKWIVYIKFNVPLSTSKMLLKVTVEYLLAGALEVTNYE
jgi:hypothetical protein